MATAIAAPGAGVGVGVGVGVGAGAGAGGAGGAPPSTSASTVLASQGYVQHALTPALWAQFHVARVLGGAGGAASSAGAAGGVASAALHLNSIDIDATGDWAVSATDEETFQLISIDQGSVIKSVHNKRYGCTHVRFTHAKHEVIFALKNDWEYSLRYLSLHDNRFHRSFKGHRAPITSVSMCAKDDTCLSGSVDSTVRMWDIRAPQCQGVIHGPGRMLAAHDREGVVFSVVAGDNFLRLYDRRVFNKGPFAAFNLAPHEPLEFTSVAFSPSSESLLVSTTTNALYLVDAFEGHRLHTFSGFANRGRSALGHAYSPDGKFVLAGSEDGSVHIFDVASGGLCGVWEGTEESGPVRALAVCPTKLCVLTGAAGCSLWAPTDVPRQSLASAASSAAALSNGSSASGAGSAAHSSLATSSSSSSSSSTSSTSSRFRFGGGSSTASSR